MSRLLKILLLSAALSSSSFFACLPTGASGQVVLQDAHVDAPSSSGTTEWRRLKAGEVVVEMIDRGETKFVSARILIDAPPARVWSILANPFEFEKKISPKMERVVVLADTMERSILKCRFNMFFPLPPVSFVIESNYDTLKHVSFQRRAGIFKDFKGCWSLASHEDGLSTEVIYSMYVDPGVPVPQWIVRKTVTCELPLTLVRLRERITQLDTTGSEPVKRSIQAARVSESIVQVVNRQEADQ